MSRTTAAGARGLDCTQTEDEGCSPRDHRFEERLHDSSILSKGLNSGWKVPEDLLRSEQRIGTR